MAKRQRLTLQQVLDEIFIDPLSENDEKDHFEEVSAFIEPAVRVFMVGAAVFKAVCSSSLPLFKYYN